MRSTVLATPRAARSGTRALGLVAVVNFWATWSMCAATVLADPAAPSDAAVSPTTSPSAVAPKAPRASARPADAAPAGAAEVEANAVPRARSAPLPAATQSAVPRAVPKNGKASGQPAKPPPSAAAPKVARVGSATRAQTKPKLNGAQSPSVKRQVLPKNALVAILPVRGGGTTASAVGGGESADTLSRGRDVERELASLLRQQGYRVMQPATTRQLLRPRRAARSCVEGVGRCDFRALLRPLQVAAVVSTAIWEKNGAPVEVFVRVTRPTSEGMQARAVSQTEELLPMLREAALAAVRKAELPAAISVRVETTPPGALVTVDRQRQAQAPATFALPVGKHLLVVSHPGHVTRSVFVDVPETGTTPVVRQVVLVPDPVTQDEARLAVSGSVPPRVATPAPGKRVATGPGTPATPPPPASGQTRAPAKGKQGRDRQAKDTPAKDAQAKQDPTQSGYVTTSPEPPYVGRSDAVPEVKPPRELDKDELVGGSEPYAAAPPTAHLPGTAGLELEPPSPLPPSVREPAQATPIVVDEGHAWETHWPDYVAGGVLAAAAVILLTGAIETAMGDGRCVERDPAVDRCVTVQNGHPTPLFLGAALLGASSAAVFVLTPLTDLTTSAGVQIRARL